MSIDITSAEGARRHHLTLHGELDMAEVPVLEAAVARISGEPTISITIDLSRLAFIDSSGLAALVHIQALCAKSGCEFELIPGRPSVQRLFEITGLGAVLPFRAAA